MIPSVFVYVVKRRDDSRYCHIHCLGGRLLDCHEYFVCVIVNGESVSNTLVH